MTSRLARSVALLTTCCAAVVAVLPSSAAAAPEGPACHCFRERTYDPVNPAAADPYILATTRSSTLAAVYGADKKTLVRAVMSGTSPDDLWVAYWAGARAGRDPQALLAAKRAAGSWASVFAGRDDRAKLGAPFADRLANRASDEELSAIAVDDVAVSRLRADGDLVRVTRAAGAGSPELLLTLLLAPRLKRGPPEILAQVKSGKSWGALLSDAGIAAPDIDDVVRAAASPPVTQPWLLK